MSRYLPESKELQQKIKQIRDEIQIYTSVIDEVSEEERSVLQDHVRQLRARLEMTEKTRKQALRRFYSEVHSKK